MENATRAFDGAREDKDELLSLEKTKPSLRREMIDHNDIPNILRNSLFGILGMADVHEFSFERED